MRTRVCRYAQSLLHVGFHSGTQRLLITSFVNFEGGYEHDILRSASGAIAEKELVDRQIKPGELAVWVIYEAIAQLELN